MDTLINHAGFGGQGAFLTRPAAADLAMLQVNAAVPTELMKLLLPKMVARGRGRVLNVVSIAACFPGPNQAEYFATKAYLASLSTAIGAELAGSGVTVTTLLPGPVETGFSQAGDLTKTWLFRPGSGADPVKVARQGYAAMLAGKPTVFAAVNSPLKLAAKTYPWLPHRLALRVIAALQEKR